MHILKEYNMTFSMFIFFFGGGDTSTCLLDAMISTETLRRHFPNLFPEGHFCSFSVDYSWTKLNNNNLYRQEHLYTRVVFVYSKSTGFKGQIQKTSVHWIKLSETKLEAKSDGNTAICRLLQLWTI